MFSFIRTVTVGSGLSPDLLDPLQSGKGARGLTDQRPHTAGGDFHPALRTLHSCPRDSSPATTETKKGVPVTRPFTLSVIQTLANCVALQVVEELTVRRNDEC
jgi:hypothetical protein